MWSCRPGKVSISAGMPAACGAIPDGHDSFTYVGDPIAALNMSSTGFIGGRTGRIQLPARPLRVRPGSRYRLSRYIGEQVSQQPPAHQPLKAAAKHTVRYRLHRNNSSDMCQVNAKYSISSDLYGDLTARLGYAADRTLFYVKGGVALLDADIKANYEGQNCLTLGTCPPAVAGQKPASTFNASNSDTLVGWTSWSGCRIRFEPLLVSQGGIPALRLRNNVVLRYNRLRQYSVGEACTITGSAVRH